MEMGDRLWTQEQFNCPICLDLPHDPATIPCGHSYCMECIKDYWGKDDHIGIYSCPECRQTFCPKPPLSRNTMLAEAVEQLRRGALKPRLSVRAAQHPSAVPGSPAPSASPGGASFWSAAVPCDVCQGAGLRPAVKSCLVCLASYCEVHLKPHRQAPALKRHELVGPTAQLVQKICAQHKYLHEFYCRSCQAFICWLCTSSQHKGHDTTSTQAERTERQKELGEVQSDNLLKLQEREKELCEMKKVVESLKRSLDRVQGDTDLILSELQRSVERLQALVREVLDSGGQDKLREAQEVVDKLEAEVTELKKRDVDTRQLVVCEDNIHFLQNFQALCSPLNTGDLASVTAKPEASFENVRTAMLELREKVEDMCNKELSYVTKTVKDTVLFTLGECRANKNTGQRFKFEFFKLFTGLGTKSTDKRDPGPPSTSLSIQSVERRVPVHGLPCQDVRSRDEPRERGTMLSQQRQPETRRKADTLWHVTPAAGVASGSPHPPLHPPVVGSSLVIPGTTVLEEQVNPGLFLDFPISEGSTTPMIPGLREIPLQNLQPPDPRTRPEFLHYACRLTLDPDTAHRRLCLSEGNTKATLQGSTQLSQERPERFDGWTQVLCREALPGDRCYWEVEWRGRGSSLGVAYAALARKGADARAGLGYNAASWSLELSDTCCSAMHNGEKQDIAVSYSPRVGVYLDRRAGTLAFYSIADSMVPLHTFHARFVEPLFAAFGVGSGVGVGLDFALGQFSSISDSVKICPI